LLVDSVESMMMHGLANPKYIYIYIYWYIKYIKIFYIKYKHLVATTILWKSVKNLWDLTNFKTPTSIFTYVWKHVF